jgi:hypothetical protein
MCHYFYKMLVFISDKFIECQPNLVVGLNWYQHCRFPNGMRNSVWMNFKSRLRTNPGRKFTRCIRELLTHICVTCIDKKKQEIIMSPLILLYITDCSKFQSIYTYCNRSLHRNHPDSRIYHHKLNPSVNIAVHIEIFLCCTDKAEKKFSS